MGYMVFHIMKNIILFWNCMTYRGVSIQHYPSGNYAMLKFKFCTFQLDIKTLVQLNNLPNCRLQFMFFEIINWKGGYKHDFRTSY
jgi:hypothetical protein